ncbi:glycosyltransferase [Pelagibius litoralis]|uniref:Glycosyltransferase n=1 Tax=Pelagibius litoralis TaxID=374515 RepID=A0A967EUW5_9PROT|nr:glycosyltransferase [Pelagibius litoralis]NIA67637.1 glycosyltransferase [Pelagibius litoralis]
MSESQPILPLVLLGLCVLAVVYPYVIYPALLALVPRRPLVKVNARLGDEGEQLRLSLAFCAYNEAPTLPEKIANLRLLRQADPALEILAYSDGSSDETAALLKAEEDWIRVFASDQRLGKSQGMNTLVAAAEGELIIFTDANVMVEPASLDAVRQAFTDPSVGCVCGRLIYTNPDDGTTAATGALYWRLEEKVKAMESRCGSTMGADGSIFAVRRALYPTVPPDIIDDMFVSLSILCDGHRVVRVPEVLARERSATDSADEFRRKVRIACQAFNCHRLLWPRLRRLSALDLFKYVSHKLLRWFGIYFVLLGIMAAMASLWLMSLTVAAVCLPFVLAAIYAVGRRSRLSLLSKGVEILRAMAATGWGLLRSRRGDRYQTWELPQSSRKAG